MGQNWSSFRMLWHFYLDGTGFSTCTYTGCGFLCSFYMAIHPGTLAIVCSHIIARTPEKWRRVPRLVSWYQCRSFVSGMVVCLGHVGVREPNSRGPGIYTEWRLRFVDEPTRVGGDPDIRADGMSPWRKNGICIICFRCLVLVIKTNLSAENDMCESEPQNPILCCWIHRSPVNSLRKGQWPGALLFSLICAWTNAWSNNGDAGDLRHHRAHYDVTVLFTEFCL